MKTAILLLCLFGSALSKPTFGLIKDALTNGAGIGAGADVGAGLGAAILPISSGRTPPGSGSTPTVPANPTGPDCDNGNPPTPPANPSGPDCDNGNPPTGGNPPSFVDFLKQNPDQAKALVNYLLNGPGLGAGIGAQLKALIGVGAVGPDGKGIGVGLGGDANALLGLGAA